MASPSKGCLLPGEEIGVCRLVGPIISTCEAAAAAASLSFFFHMQSLPPHTDPQTTHPCTNLEGA